MKITRLKLVNFIGIKHGMDQDEVEIVFQDGKIIMLNGGNGSGKTTILSQLHPFKDSFDARKSPILDDLDGLKEIDIEHEGSLYEIIHTYEKNAKSFIKKDGVEMNENGGVRTFNEYVETEFGLTTDYFKIGKIGSNTENFIKFTATDRKKYISKFLPDIEDYLVRFEIVKTKFNELSNNIKSVAKDLDKLEDEETVNLRIDSYQKLIESLDTEIEKVGGRIAVLNSDINMLESDLVGIDLAALELTRSEKEQEKMLVVQEGIKFIGKHGKKTIEECENVIKEKEKIVGDLREEIAIINANRQSTNATIIGLENEVKKLEFNLDEFDVTESLEEIERNIETISDSLKELRSNENRTIKSMIEEDKNIATYLSRFEDLKNFIDKYFNDLKGYEIAKDKANIEMFMESDIEARLIGQATTIRNLISGKQTAIANYKSELQQKEADYVKFSSFYEGKDGIEDDVFDEKCSGCPLVADVLEYKKLPEQIQNIKDSMEQMEKDLEEFELKAERFGDLKNLAKTFNTYFSNMGPRTNKVYLYFVDNYGSLVKKILGNYNDFKNDMQEVIDTVNETISTIQDISTLESSLQNYEYKKNMIVNNEKLKKQITDNIDSKKKQITTKNTELSTLIANGKNKSIDLDNEKEILEDYEGFLTGKKTIKDITSTVENLKLQEDEYNKKSGLLKDKKTLLLSENTELTELKNRRTTSNKNLMDSKMILTTISKLKTKQIELDADYKNFQTLKNALDPNKGIPLYFIKAYLEKTKDIANELLNLAFDGNFEIDFVTSAKEFFIRVRTGEYVKNDIADASQGETALTTISISLALIEQSIGAYNILALDEIDGPLDTQNRESFLNILNKQIDKLGIEQVFIISHNDAFDTEEMDLILLRDSNVHQKGPEFMSNKKVIFEVIQ
jgi:DNA repair exonuclease SbcCD ATPase subunit